MSIMRAGPSKVDLMETFSTVRSKSCISKSQRV